MAALTSAQEQEPAQAVAEVAAAVVQVAATVLLAERRAESAIPDGEQPALLFSSRERAEEEAAVVAALSTSFSLPPEQAVPDRRSSFPLAARRVMVQPPPEPRWIPQSPWVQEQRLSVPGSCEKR